ncbi:hypothetical protein AAG906_017086 [Vitis piasezkii]
MSHILQQAEILGWFGKGKRAQGRLNLARKDTLYIHRELCISSFWMLFYLVSLTSSTDNYPKETIENTLDPRDQIQHSASYWSSEGEVDPLISESLVHKLISNLPHFQFGHPVYSVKAVRFQRGHQQYLMYRSGDATNDPTAEFPMAQENRLQKFKLPELALCIGGILQIELLGGVQKQEMDGLSYICDTSASPYSSIRRLGADTASWMQSGARSIEQMITERLLGAATENDSNDCLPTLWFVQC